MALLVVAAPVARAEPPPLTAFTEFPQYEWMQISPGGKHLALTRRTSEYEGMTVLTMPELGPSMQTKFGAANDIESFAWVSDVRLLVHPSRRFPGYTTFKVPTGEIIGIDADGRRGAMLFGFQAGEQQTGSRMKKRESIDAAGELLALLPGYPDEVLIQTYGFGALGDFSVAYRMNVINGKLAKLATSPIRNGTFLTDSQRRVALVAGQDDDGDFQVYYRPEGKGEWQRVVDDKRNDGTLNPVAPFGTGGEFLALENRKAPTRGVVVWSPATGAERELFRHKHSDLELAGIDPRGEAWIFSYVDHFPEYWYPEPAHPLAQAHGWLRGTFRGHAVEITSQTDDMSLAVARISAPQTAPIFLVVDVKNRKILRHLASRPELKPESLAAVDPFEFNARDGLRVRGYVTVPRGTTGKQLPMVVLIHGGPHGVYDAYDFDPEVQLFASRGYAVLQVNYRGSGGRGRAFVGAGYGRWGREIQDDITDAVKWAIADGVADPQRICAYGASFGAYAALTGAFREPALFKCVVGLAGVYDLPLMFEEGDIQQVERGMNYLKDAVGTDMEELKRRSPVYNAEKIRAAVLLMHGKIDTRAPYEHALRMRAALEKAGHPPEWSSEWGEGHGFFDEANRAAAYQRILDFFAKHIGAAATG